MSYSGPEIYLSAQEAELAANRNPSTAFTVPDISLIAARLQGRQSLTLTEINALAEALRRIENGFITLKSVLSTFTVPSWFPTISIGLPEENPPIVATDSGEVFIRGNVDVDGEVAARSFRLKQPLLYELTFINNSPSSGHIAWSACKLYYSGQEYSIPSGNTDKLFLYWVAGANTFTAADSFTPAINHFLIAVNDGGTADEGWNKPVTRKSIQRSQIMFPLLEGIQPQAIVEHTLNLNGGANYTLLNVTGSGLLINCSVIVKTAPANNPTASIQIQLDDSIIFSIVFYLGQNIWNRTVYQYCDTVSGDGSAVNHRFVLPLYLPFKQSLIVSTGAPTSTGTGEVYVSAWHGLKTP